MPSRTSLDSSAPIMAPSNSTTPSSTAPPSNRTSIFGTQAPAAQPLGRSNTITSTASRQTLSSESSQREIKKIEDGLNKLENKKLGQQRYVPSAMKETDMSALKLGAKLERALGRRLGGQDAVMRPRGQTIDTEKGALAA